MRAIQITQPGGPDVLKMREVPTPVPASGQVLIRVQAAGVNRPDVLLREGKYGDVAGLVPGLEVAGVVEACGAEAPRWQPGDAVCALLPAGGYAEYAAVDARHCLPLPTGWNPIEAAGLPETVFTVWHNVFQRGALQPGERLLVHGGSSGIGITAIQLARALGSEVAVTAGSAAKCQACRELGADWAINYKTEDFEEILAAAGGVDVVLDMIGGDYTPKNLRLLRPDGPPGVHQRHARSAGRVQCPRSDAASPYYHGQYPAPPQRRLQSRAGRRGGALRVAVAGRGPVPAGYRAHVSAGRGRRRAPAAGKQ